MAAARQHTPEEVVGKVLRRLEVAKIARKLQDRLALASYKAQNGYNDMSFTYVEAHVESTLKRKRPSSSLSTLSDSSSTSSELPYYSSAINSSPIAPHLFSTNIHGAGKGQGPRKNPSSQPKFVHLGSNNDPRNRTRARSMAPPMFESSRTSWKTTYNLPESSPVYHNQHSHFSISQGPNLSFVSETSTVPNSPPFGHVSDDDDHHLPAHSFRIKSSTMHSSPPRTPPPTRARSTRHRKGNAAGEEGADLLLYLATSPSPANHTTKSRVYPPSTPPSNTAALPSSMMSTPGVGGFMAGFNTPGQQFNFADFVNITPSPAQGVFGNRTPGPAKTPLAAKEARRRLNFDTLLPPGGSPNLSNIGRGPMGKESGLGMELGGELVS